jgi:hypothetical protein
MFGSSLLFAGDELLVGAFGENLQSGAVYSFARSGQGWEMHQRLVGSETVKSDGFGTALAGDGERLLVGAPVYLQNGIGSVVEWRRRNGAWVESAVLRPANEPNLRHFGRHIVHRDTDSWFVGAERRADVSIVGIDVYTYESVDEELTLAAHASLPYVGSPGYGLNSLAAEGTELFLGLSFSVAAPWSDAGEVRILDESGTQSSLSAGVTATHEGFGAAVAANSRWLLVGTPRERRQSAQSGAVFAYDLDDFQATPAAVMIDPEGKRGDGSAARSRSVAKPCSWVLPATMRPVRCRCSSKSAPNGSAARAGPRPIPAVTSAAC